MNAKQVDQGWIARTHHKENAASERGVSPNVAERTGSAPSVSHRPPPHPIVISTRRASDGRGPKTTVDDTAVAPVWNARARSSFLIAQAMRPRGFAHLWVLVAVLGLLGMGFLAAALHYRGSIIDAQRDTIAVQRETITLVTARADACGAAVLPAIDTLRKCRAVLEARDEACACWVAPEGDAQ